LHPLDDKRSFMKLSHLHSPSTGIAWSHCISYPHIRASELYVSYAKRLVGAMI